ncbi:HAD family hydrolase [Pusillimonas sp.]|uniref:HAD family hydrolase n=1 Tax=Pusillimonas sp. TaxID=3040095 RepID=UPI0037CAA7A8
MTTPRNLALFDLDHTLLPLDSDYQWADFLARTGRAGDPVEAQRLNNELMERYNAGNLTAQEAAEFMLGLLAAAATSDLAEWHQVFMREIIEPNILPVARELVDKHLQQGDLCAIVTATNEFVTAPIARAFNIPHLIATVPEMHENRYTGAIHGVPSFQEGKVTRVNEWLAGQGLNLQSFERSYFYSDSTNDLPLLEAVTDPIAANPSPTLRQVAQSRGWLILDIFKDMQDAKS